MSAGLLGAAFFAWTFDARIVDGRRIDWVMITDRSQNFLGWDFYRRVAETFPLGGIPTLLAPVGSSLAYSDAFPWFALAMKPLSPLLPSVFQIAGLWLLLAFVLQGVFAFLILERLLAAPLVSLLGSAFAIASPALVGRVGHISLCAHWLILAAFYALLADRPGCSLARFAARWSPLLVLACGTHPYLAAMVVPLALSSCFLGLPDAAARWSGAQGGRGGGGRARLAELCARILLVLAVSLGGLYSFGYFATSAIGEAGFGFFSANATTLWNPMGDWSRLLPSFAVGEGQYEGAAFVGIGPLALLAAALAWRALGLPRGAEFRAAPIAVLPAAAVVAAMALFALSSRIYLGGVKLATLATFYSFLEPLPSAFRSSGRFIWPLHAAVILGSVVLLARSIGRRSVVVAALVAALGLQAWDAGAAYRRYDLRAEGAANRWNPLRQLAWLQMGAGYREVRLVPPYIHDAACPESAWPPFSYLPFAFLAGRQGMAINSAHLSRKSSAQIEAACRVVLDELARDALSPDAVYVVSEPYAERFRRLGEEAAVCGRLDGFLVCVRADRATALRDALLAAQ